MQTNLALQRAARGALSRSVKPCGPTAADSTSSMCAVASDGVQLTPVGALTSKPYAFTSRQWELKPTDSIDVFDAVGSNIRIDSYGKQVRRVMPRVNELINLEWISDKVRFSYDGYAAQRLTTPMVRTNGQLGKTDWEAAFNSIKAVLSTPGVQVEGRFGGFVEKEALVAFRELLGQLGAAENISGPTPLTFTPGNDFVFNTTLNGIDEADALLLIGANPRHEAPILNLRILTNVRYNNLWVGSIGPHADLTYKAARLGNSPQALLDLVAGNGPASDILRKAKRPMVILGMSALQRADGQAFLNAVKLLSKDVKIFQPDWNGFNILHTHANSVTALQLGMVGRPSTPSKKASGPRVLYLLDYDETVVDRSNYDFVVYQGHHGDRNAPIADVILPGSMPIEKNGTYVNLEGRVQKTKFVSAPPGDARNDVKILQALGVDLGVYDRSGSPQKNVGAASVPDTTATSGQLNFSDTPITLQLGDFYLNDSISRSSKIMALTSSRFKKHRSNF
eukprot:TRINITY_DN9456_c0_g1_i1.p1 TRINITY_DN9456_c0_g1~~TRINITY_DN9456_c0_g1_i1.p1  ORF type:complete len:508 (+),score=192.32 TRINITY_DN9456_c0_g1_i1:176-1699(+)